MHCKGVLSLTKIKWKTSAYDGIPGIERIIIQINIRQAKPAKNGSILLFRFGNSSVITLIIIPPVRNAVGSRIKNANRYVIM